jgi:hypothetical protein
LCTERLGVVDYMMCAKILTPPAGFCARGSGNDRESSKSARKLDQDRTDPTRCTDNQQVAHIGWLFRTYSEAIKQQFPRGNRRQRQGCIQGETQTSSFFPTTRSLNR